MHPLTAVHRQAQIGLRAATVRDLLTLWPALDPKRLDDTYRPWAAAVGLLVDRNRATSTDLAATYLSALRRTTLGAPGVDVARAGPLDAQRLDVALRVTSLVALKRATAAGVPLETAAANAFTLNAGAMSRLVLDAGRDTVVETVRADPRARGWQRVVSPSACEFCQLLGDRGAVYDESSAGFEAHDHCTCSAEPIYR